MNPYFRLMRLDKPIGIWLLLSPTLWALWIAGNGSPHLKNIIIFIVGTILMRSAGCVINDIADRNFDQHVKRTKVRPLASGEVTTFQAYVIFGMCTFFSAGLLFFLNLLSFKLSLIALFLAVLYPFTKRWFACPQIFLSMAFGMGIPMAFAAEINQLNHIAVLLFIANFIWVMIYDTEYAMSDREDDLKISLHSSAILLGKADIYFIIILQILFLLLMIFIGNLLGHHKIYDLSLVFVAGLFFYQDYLILVKVNQQNRNRDNCFKAFINNQWVGLIIYLGILFSTRF